MSRRRKWKQELQKWIRWKHRKKEKPLHRTQSIAGVLCLGELRESVCHIDDGQQVYGMLFY